MATARPAPDSSLADLPARERIDGLLLRRLAERMGRARLRYALGRSTVDPPEGPPVATLRFRDRLAVLGLVLDPEVRFGDAYAEGRIEVEGDLVAAVETAYRALSDRPASPLSWLGTLRRNSLRRARTNVQHHYDLGNDFYALWLDEQLLYTCAYFESPGQSLEDAQVAKMDHVCRKIGLRPGETVVEAGCGWGALALHMARRYGARVQAYNVSREQVAWARARARREGLEERVEFVQDDYRAIRGRFDAFVSVGMLEHVGRTAFPDLGRVIARSLDPERGRGLLHFIGRDRPRPLNAWIRRNIFPGAYAPALAEVDGDVLGAQRMEVVDVENLRPHYALTLRHWRERYEQAAAEGRVGRDERFRRTWRLYLAGSEAAFGTGSLQLFQVVFAPRGARGVPWTRRPLYESGQGLAWNAPTS